jgi:nucleoside-diphosphate-sugar epimerase
MKNDQIFLMQDDARDLLKKINTISFDGKKILLTGASGLIGLNFLAFFSELVKELKDGIKLTGIINSEPGGVLKEFGNEAHIELIRGDLTSPSFIESLGKYDYIIHAASYGQPGRFMSDPIKTLQLNTVATFELFKHLENGGKFLFISTSEVYSGNPDLPYTEEQIGMTNTTHPRACYIEAKRCGEAICNSYRSQGVNAFSARLALAYGPGTKSDDQRVLNVFIKRGFLEKKIALQDMGAAIRTYCYVSDAIEIMLNILISGDAPIYNVGGIEKTTIAKLAQAIGDYLKVPVEFPITSSEMSHAPTEVDLDMSLVKKKFQKNNFLPLSEGLKKTISWQKSLYIN